MPDKDSLRSAWRRTLANQPVGLQWGKAAETLRGLQHYRDAVTVFATPGESLYQARINCLVDGKNLVMPAPSLREGFFFIPAHTVPYKNFPAAVTYKGLHKSGQLLKNKSIHELSVGLLLNDALAVDLEGGRIGDGNGFFDLSCALLHELNGLRQEWTVLTFIQEGQISRDLLPQNTWDIKVSGAVTPAKLFTFEPPSQKPQIFWDALAHERTKRIDPLWKLYNDRLKAED